MKRTSALSASLFAILALTTPSVAFAQSKCTVTIVNNSNQAFFILRTKANIPPTKSVVEPIDCTKLKGLKNQAGVQIKNVTATSATILFTSSPIPNLSTSKGSTIFECGGDCPSGNDNGCIISYRDVLGTCWKCKNSCN